MNAEPKREPLQPEQAGTPATRSLPLTPVGCWRSAAIGITAYVFEESETAIRQSGLVPEWINYPSDPGNGVAVPAHHDFPNYLKLLRLQGGDLRLVIDVRAVLREDSGFKDFLAGLTADGNLSLVRKESA